MQVETDHNNAHKNKTQQTPKGAAPLRFYNRIAFKVCSIIILVEVTILVVMGTYYVSHFSRELEKRVETEIRTPANLINQGVLTYNAIQNTAIITKIVGSEFIEGFIVGLNRRIFYASNPDYDGSTIDDVAAGSFQSHFFDFSIKDPKIAYVSNKEGKFLHCLSPLFAIDGKTPRFFLYLKIGTTWIQRERAHVIAFYALSSLLCILVTSILILFVLHNFIFFKLSRLARAYDTIKGGVFQSNIPARMIDSKDEIGVLARGFHTMTKTLGATTTSIDNLNQEIFQREQAEIKLKKAIETAEAATRAKSIFLANMSHEIRTPLNGVIGMTELIMTTELTEEQLEFAQTIKNSGQSLLTVINDILDYSKIEAGKLDFETIDFDLRTAIEDAADTMAVSAHAKGIELVAVLNPDVPALVQGDPGRLRQILTNLVNNAIKFTPQGEVLIVVSLLSESETHVTIRVSVKDTGIGIASDRAAGLFQSFSQVDASTSRKFGGTGLGLAISKRLCEMMGGRIGVNSRVGIGSEFWFTATLKKLPRKIRTEKAQAEAVSGKRILVVDANATSRQAVQNQLRAWECRCDGAADGASAMGMLCAAASTGSPYDIAILDMQMPDMDAAMLGTKIKHDAALAPTELVMLTSLGIRGDAARMRDIGFSSYLTKPIKQAHLFQCIATIGGAKSTGNNGASRPLITKHSLSEDHKGRIRILVAEDNIINQKVILNLLAKFGYHADVVSDGREAIEALSSTPYHLVLMDVQMPEMDGLQATMEIRDPQSTVIDHDIPVIALTARAMKGDREKCVQAGMNDYASKPIDPAKLMEKLKKWSAGETSD